MILRAQNKRPSAKGSIFALALLLGTSLVPSARAETLTIGIGTQDTTTNTATVGTVIRELGLLQKFLPHTGKYAGITYDIEWQNFTSGPPVTNGMMADKLQFGMMGDYPLVVNGYIFQHNPQSKSELIAVAAYNLQGSGNGVDVNVNSPYYSLEDLKGKVISVPFGSAAHGMLLKAMQDHGWPQNYFTLVNQSPEVGSTNLQEGKIDAHADFVPFPELLAYKGFARKIYDGMQTGVPTWHGVVVRTDFAQKYPEIVKAYLQAVLAANAWLKQDPVHAAQMISQWTGTPAQIVYMYLGPDGLMTVDPTIKPVLLQAAATDAGVLSKLGKIHDFDVKPWANDSYLRAVYKQNGLNYGKQLASTANYDITGEDDYCKKPITSPRQAGELWVDGEGVSAYSSTLCTLGAYGALTKQGKKISMVYLFDAKYGMILYGEQAYFAVSKQGGTLSAEPFLRKPDAVAEAAKDGGQVMTFPQLLSAVQGG